MFGEGGERGGGGGRFGVWRGAFRCCVGHGPMWTQVRQMDGGPAPNGERSMLPFRADLNIVKKHFLLRAYGSAPFPPFAAAAPSASCWICLHTGPVPGTPSPPPPSAARRRSRMPPRTPSPPSPPPPPAPPGPPPSPHRRCRRPLPSPDRPGSGPRATGPACSDPPRGPGRFCVFLTSWWG